MNKIGENISAKIICGKESVILHAWCWFGSVGIITPERSWKQTAQRVRGRNNERVPHILNGFQSHSLRCCSKNGRIIIVRKKLVAQFRCLIGLSSTFSLTHNYFCLDLGCEASHILRVSQDYGCVMCISDNLGHKSFFIS